jgi:iron complex outermembrane recepter protein
MRFVSPPATWIVTLLLAATAQAAALGGRVTDTDGRPLAGVNLRVADGPWGTASDSQGHFRLELPGEQPVRLVVSHLGYATLNTHALPGMELVLRLEPSLIEGAPVTIRADRAAPGSAVTHHNLPRAEIERRHSGQDLALLLEGTPGLLTTSYSGADVGYSEIRLRGFDQKRVEVLVNGVPLNDPEDHYVYWVDLPDMGASLEDVQIQRGVGTGHFGGSNFGGSVNLLTGFSPRPGLRLEAGHGNLDARRYSLAWGSGVVDGRWQMDARWSRIRSAGWRERTAVDQWGYMIAARRILPSGSLRFHHYNGHERTQVSWDGIDETRLFGLHGQEADRRQNNDAAYPNSVDDFIQPHFELLGDWRLPDGSELDATLYYIDGEGYYETWKPGAELREYGLEAFSEWRPDPDQEGVFIEHPVQNSDLVNRRWIEKRTAGFHLAHRRSLGELRLCFGLHGYSYHGEHWGEVVWVERQAPGSTAADRYYTHLSDKERIGLLLSAEQPLGGGLLLSARLAAVRSVYGLRQLPGGHFQGDLLNRFEDEQLFLNPALGLGWQPGEGFSLYTSAAIANREPSRSEYWNAWQGPDDLGVRPLFARADTLADGSLAWRDPLIEPERMLDLELGAEWRRQDWWLKANLYWMQLRNEIVDLGGVDEESPIKGNAPRSRRIGLELDGRWRANAVIELGGNLALSHNRIEELVVHETVYNAEWTPALVIRDFAGNPIALSPERIANLWIDWSPWPAFSLRPALQIVGPQHLDNSGDDGFTVLDPALVDPRYLDAQGRPLHSKTLDGWTSLGLDARLGLQPWLHQDLELRLKVSNLLDAEYETGGYWNDWVDADGDGLYEPQRSLYPAAGRHWWLTLALRM